MREVIFRGKDSDTGEIVFGFYKVNLNPQISDSSLCWHNVLPESVSEYTGVEDKNGKKIFENDYVLLRSRDGNATMATVVFKDGQFQVLFRYKRGKDYESDYYQILKSYMTLID